MAISLADFNKIWSSTSPLSPYTFSDDNYNEGWNFIGQIPPSRQMWDFLQKNNDEKMQYLANNYLPLSGGTMTGAIAVSNNTVLAKRDVTNSFIVVEGGTNASNGAYISLVGKDNNTDGGAFNIVAHDGSVSKSLFGKPDGTLTWNANSILTASNYNSYALPLSGGTMMGDVKFTITDSIFRSVDDSFLAIFGGSAYRKGAYMALCGKDKSGNSGAFELHADDGTTKKTFTGKPDGTLTWDGQPLLPVGVVQAFAGTTIPTGWLLCDGSAVSRTTYANLFACIGTTYGTGDGSTTFNLPDLVDKFVQGNATSGTVKSAGLPNITGQFGDIGFKQGSHFGLSVESTSGAFSVTNGAVNNYSQSSSTESDKPRYVNFKASDSNSIYGNSTTVQPPALTMKYIIKY